jgi:TatA/E family protein of Tat protein translocase
MNVLGIGPMEMGIIAVVALLIFGPGKLPEVMGQAGKMVRDFRRMSAELTGEFEKTIAEAKDMGNSITNEIGGMTKEVNSVTSSVKKDLGLKGATATSKSKAATGTKSVGSKTTSTSKPAAKPTTASTSTSATTATKRSSTSSATASTTSTTSTTSTAARKPVIPKATRDDPDADVSLFEPTPVERVRRSRKATPSIISDPTPHFSRLEPVSASSPQLAGNGDRPSASGPAVDDPLDRARQRRRSAGYARTSA